MGRFSIRKLLLDLLVIVCLVVAGWTGYQLFVSHRLDPVMGSIIFIVDIGVLIWNVAILRNHYYKRMKPSFKLVFILLLSVVLILAFAGIEPLSGYKDSIVNQVTSQIDRFKDDIVVDGDENVVSSDQDVEYEIIGFNRLWQLVDAGPRVLSEDMIELVILCQPTERTWEKAYILEVIGEGRILNTLDTTEMISWRWFHPLISETVTVYIEGPIIEELLWDARQRYEDVKLEAEGIVEKQNYNFFMKGEVPSYEEYKRQEEKMNKLRIEIKRWDAIKQGQTYGDGGYDLSDFCFEYFSISITRKVIE